MRKCHRFLSLPGGTVLPVQLIASKLPLGGEESLSWCDGVVRGSFVFDVGSKLLFFAPLCLSFEQIPFCCLAYFLSSFILKVSTPPAVLS